MVSPNDMEQRFLARKAELEKVNKAVSSCRVLLVGAGGIGCELLKNLVLSGFVNIEVFDLDTIELSNLNRQFLFQRQHVGQPKCEVARQSALQFNPHCNITSHHDSIISDKYNVNFFNNFNIVLNALDNRAARNHVNRMCLAADVPLIESGSAGYFGQVYTIKKGVSECYECIHKGDREKSYPSCTVRNTPSEPIHCIVWAKNLFCQLFGEVDADNEVSPDSADPEAAHEEQPPSQQNEVKVSTRAWAEENDYDPKKLLKKFFIDDINYLLIMKNLWTNRKPPVPIKPDSIQSIQDIEKASESELWSIETLVSKFASSVAKLKDRKKVEGREDKVLFWDKDDDVAIDFTCAAANLRCLVFGIAQQTRFNLKSMAGNIIPAIATTNAIVAGLIVIEAKKALAGNFDQCRSIFLKDEPAGRKGFLFATSQLHKPSPNCYVCSSLPEVRLRVKCDSFLVRTLEEKVLKKSLSMLMPDVEVQDGKGTIVLSSEAGETEGNLDKPLANFGIKDGSTLKADDFFQNFTLTLTICDGDVSNERDPGDDQAFVVEGQGPKPEESHANGSASNGNGVSNGSSAQSVQPVDLGSGDECVPGQEPTAANGNKRSAEQDTTASFAPSAKKAILTADDSDEDLVCLD